MLIATPPSRMSVALFVFGWEELLAAVAAAFGADAVGEAEFVAFTAAHQARLLEGIVRAAAVAAGTRDFALGQWTHGGLLAAHLLEASSIIMHGVRLVNGVPSAVFALVRLANVLESRSILLGKGAAGAMR